MRAPRLFVQGARDTIGPPGEAPALVESLPEPTTLVAIAEADHFFTGKLDELEETIAAWAAERPWSARP